MLATLIFLSHFVLQLLFIGRALLRPHREPASRIAWVVVILIFPVIGMLAYLLFGETNIGRKRTARVRRALKKLPAPDSPEIVGAPGGTLDIHDHYTPLFRLGETINGFRPVGGNAGHLTRDSNDAIDTLVADIDTAEQHVHLCFYIWLSDNNGLKVVEALKRAAARGVDCRAMADALGSHPMIKSKHWKDMADHGVRLGVALPIRHPVLRAIKGRIDLRNHRKNVVIDNWITYCGSQNCADPEFRIKPKYAPWVDALMRFEGPIARQSQYVFASDWMACTGEDISELLRQAPRASDSGFTAQVIATGPTVRASAAPETFEALMYAARERLIITTPYFVPNESIQSALCAAANRGVDTTIVFPARNDSWIVAATSRSYYADLLEAGVKIHEYVGGLLHTKSMTADGTITLIGSANMDRRSFELNYENNILFCDSALTAEMIERQMTYLASSNPVTLDDVNGWSTGKRLKNNAIAMLGPLL